MGRFYKTAKPTFVDDAMYQAPHELMLNALKSQDAAFNKKQEELDEFETMGDLLDYVDKDEGARTAALQKHRDRALDLTEKINENPALASVYMGEINKAKRAFNEDIKTGSLFKMDRAAKRRAALREKINSRKDISEEARNQALLKIDRDYAGVEQGGDYAEDLHIYNEMDEGTFQKGLKETIAVNGIGTTTTLPDGRGYLVKNGETKTYITEERVRDIVTSDPAVEDWKREQLQTLERRVENGEIDEEQMTNIFTQRYNDFVDNTITKLAFEKINTDEDVHSTDSTFMGKLRLAQAERHFNTARADRIEDNFVTEVDGNIEEVDDQEVETIFNEDIVTGQYGPLTVDGEGLPIKMTTAEKRAMLESGRNNLIEKLKLTKDNLKTFRDKMMTPEGRKALAESTEMSIEELSMQANYNKSYELSTPTVPDYDKNNPDKKKEQKDYIKTTQTALNQYLTSTPVQVDILDKNGKRTRKTMSVAELADEGLISGATLTSTIPGKPLKNGEGFYLDTTKQPIDKIIVGEDGEDKLVPKTMEEIEAEGISVLRSKEKKVAVRDNTKPLLDVKPEEIMESSQTEYDGARKPRKTDYYTIIKNSRDGNNNSQQVLIYIPKKDIDVKRQ